MKTTLLVGILLFFSFSLKSQTIYSYCFEPNINCAGYEMGVPEPVLTLENTPDNVWQICSPQKASFISGFNSARAIMTDSVNSYPINNTSSFVISWTTVEPSNSVHWATFDLSFAYQVNSDTLTDYGSVEFSPDNGTTWINLLNDPAYNSYLNWDVADSNGSVPPVLSGNSNGWIYRSVDLADLGVYLAIPAGTTILWRFSFTSDGNQTNKEGLMFDDILIQITPPLSVQEESTEMSHCLPNPASSTITTRFSAKH